MGGESVKIHDNYDIRSIIKGFNKKSNDVNLPLFEREKYARVAKIYAERLKCYELIAHTTLGYYDILISQGRYNEAIKLLNNLHDDSFLHEVSDSLKIEFFKSAAFAYYIAAYNIEPDKIKYDSLCIEEFFLNEQKKIQIFALDSNIKQNQQNNSTPDLENFSQIAILVVVFIVLLLMIFLIIFRRKNKYIYKLQKSLKEKENNSRELKFSESKYYSLIRALDEGLIHLNKDDRILFLNEKACQILGGIFDDLINNSLYDFFVDHDDVKIFRHKKEQREKGIADRYEFKLKKIQGKIIWVRFSLSPILDENKTWVGNVGMITDITERKEFDNSMKELTANLNQKIKQLDCLYDISDITSVPGITFEEIFVKSLDIIPFGLKYSHDACVEVVFENKKYRSKNFIETEWNYVVPIKVQKKKLGHICVCYIEEKPFINKDPFHFNEKIIIKNIAEKLGQVIEAKNMENELRNTNHKLDLVQKVAKVGILELDLIRNKIIFSESFFDLLKVPIEKRFFFDDELFYQMIVENYRERIKNIFHKIMKSDFETITFECSFYQNAGKIKHFFFTGDICKNVEDKPEKVIFTIKNIKKPGDNVNSTNTILRNNG